jgi:hypothetical protein
MKAKKRIHKIQKYYVINNMAAPTKKKVKTARATTATGDAVKEDGVKRHGGAKGGRKLDKVPATIVLTERQDDVEDETATSKRAASASEAKKVIAGKQSVAKKPGRQPPHCQVEETLDEKTESGDELDVDEELEEKTVKSSTENGYDKKDWNTEDHSKKMVMSRDTRRTVVKTFVKTTLFKGVKFLVHESQMKWDYVNFAVPIMDHMGIEGANQRMQMWAELKNDAKKALHERRATVNGSIKGVVVGK